jgi:hypothetical protein
MRKMAKDTWQGYITNGTLQWNLSLTQIERKFSIREINRSRYTYSQ